jgi:uncharacterized protein YecE (DUF72 family)
VRGNCAAARCHPFEVACELRIGTSGWHYKHWMGPFYPKNLRTKEMLAYYARHFDTAELNNTFYRLPEESAFDCWRDSVPEGFVFAVKASRFLTHNLKLKAPEQALRNLLPRAERLREKLGPILFQLPPRWRVNVERLDGFLEHLPKNHRYVFEFREPTWHAAPVVELLRRHGAAYCIYELAGFSTDRLITSDFAYVRLHGPGGKYQGSYSNSQLTMWARQIEEWAQHLKAVYVYFDNDQAGYAAGNAIRLKEILGSRTQLSAA